MDWSIFQFLRRPSPPASSSRASTPISACTSSSGASSSSISRSRRSRRSAPRSRCGRGTTRTTPGVYWMSLAFTLIGAVIFAVIKGHEARISPGSVHRHLVRGCVRRGDSHAQQGHGRGRASRDMLVGNILSVQWPEVWLTGADLRRPSAFSTMCSGADSSRSRSTRKRRRPGASPSGSGTSSSTRRLASSSRARSPLPACYWCSAT